MKFLTLNTDQIADIQSLLHSALDQHYVVLDRSLLDDGTKLSLIAQYCSQFKNVRCVWVQDESLDPKFCMTFCWDNSQL